MIYWWTIPLNRAPTIRIPKNINIYIYIYLSKNSITFTQTGSKRNTHNPSIIKHWIISCRKYNVEIFHSYERQQKQSTNEHQMLFRPICWCWFSLWYVCLGIIASSGLMCLERHSKVVNTKITLRWDE